jgi:hypothetical protein
MMPPVLEAIQNNLPGNENFLIEFATILTARSSKKVIQLCDYLGKWLHLVGSSSHFLLPFTEPSPDRI